MGKIYIWDAKKEEFVEVSKKEAYAIFGIKLTFFEKIVELIHKVFRSK